MKNNTISAKQILDLFDKPINTIVLMEFGSHLYGTSTEKSDHDYKGVFLPTVEQTLLGKIPKAYHYNSKKDNDGKNTEKDIDVEIYSLHYFIELACQGQTVALDMLHAPDNCLLCGYTVIWYDITLNRQHFYTSNIKAFVGYAKQQADKYGIKGSRLNAIKKVIDFLSPRQEPVYRIYPELQLRLEDLWHDLPKDEHIYKHDSIDNTGIKVYEICGKKFHATSNISYVVPILQKIYDNYGERARMAANNEGIDWKAVSHALRAALEVKELLTNGTITFPLKDAELIKHIKQGKESWKHVQTILERQIKRVKQLAIESNLPGKADRKFWNNFIVKVMKDTIGHN